VAPGEPKQACGAVDRSRGAFEFEKDADGCFIEVQVKITEAEAGAVFVVSERGAQAQGPECTRPLLGTVDENLTFKAFLKRRRSSCSGSTGKRAF
jgi:hypothetical protein